MTSVSRFLEPPVVAVIGSGFSGVLTAIHLLRGDSNVRVRLVERAACFGPGRAYATGNPGHLLNVRAGNMSAFPGQPDHFLDWAGVARDAFVARATYGRYLQDLLSDALRDQGARLDRRTAEAVAAWREAGRWRVALADGGALEADAVVLAVGFLAATWPRGVAVEDSSSACLVTDPWSADLDALPDGDILLLGTGLTMVDVALALARPGRRLIAVSRRGLLPLGHAVTDLAPPPDGPMATPGQALETLRSHAAAFGWRAAVDSVRPLTADVWRSWRPAERRRFLRHLRPWWDIHRHRMAPAVADKISALRSSAALCVRAGRLESVAVVDGAVRARLRFRGEAKARDGRFAAAVNCASPEGDPRHMDDGLVGDLYRRGLVRSDVLGLGLDMDDDLTMVGSDGASPGLFAVGPLTRGKTWEAVAVPDLRNQAAEAAGSVLRWLEGLQS